jgi:4-amino-4-deoxy-L-arabinose transferase-like glycosyltransferase
MDESKARSWLLAIAGLGIALRLVFAFTYWVDQPLTRDEREYLSLARSVAAGRGLVYDEALTAGPIEPFSRAPGYPTFLALTGAGRATDDRLPASVKIAQAIVGGAGVILIGLIARRLGGQRSGMAAAAIAAVYPPLVWISGYVFSESIAWPLGLAVAWMFDWIGPEESRARRLALACGLLAGVASLVRPAMIVFVALAVLSLVWRRRTACAAWLLVGAALVVGPWTARNYVRYGRLVLIAAEGGVTFWTGNHPLAIGEGDFAANPALKIEANALRARHPGKDEVAMEPVFYRDAFKWIGSHPIDWLKLEARKIFYLVVPIGPSYRSHSARYYAASVVSYGLILILGLTGLFKLGPRRTRTPGLWLLVGSAIVVCLMFFPQERFRIPIIDPALAICAGGLWASRQGRVRA